VVHVFTNVLFGPTTFRGFRESPPPRWCSLYLPNACSLLFAGYRIQENGTKSLWKIATEFLFSVETYIQRFHFIKKNEIEVTVKRAVPFLIKNFYFLLWMNFGELFLASLQR